MAVQRKVFRIEEGGRPSTPRRAPDGNPESALRHGEFMAELQALRALIAPSAPMDRDAMERARAQIAEAQAYKTELDLIYAAVDRSKDDALAHDDAHSARVSRELQAIVAGTEQATRSILQSAEEIEQTAKRLSAALKGEQDKVLVRGIQDRVVQILEACNFQDLTGQRIANVVAVLSVIEQRVARLRTIWQAIERFEPVTFHETDKTDRRYLNGPKLPGDRGHSTQNDIDGLFFRTP